jgi:hypothetical protein
MKLVKCGKCGAQFDVASMRPGTTFACGKCRNAVSVPGEAAPATMALSPEQMKKALDEARAAAAPAPAAAAPKAQPKLPPAMQARAHATSASAPTRASGASPAPAPAAAPQVATKAAPAPRAARTREPSAEPAKKSPAMTYGIIGGVVVVGAIAAVMFSGGDKPKETAQKPIDAPKAAEAAPVPVKPKDPANVDDYLSMPAADQHNSLVSRFVSTGNDATQLLHLFEWCKDPKLAGNEDAKVMKGRIVEAALKADQDCEWARLSKGDRRIRDLLQPCHDECPLSFTMPDPPEQEINERLATMGAKPWADAAEWTKWEGVVKTVREREEKLKGNPRYLMAEKKRDWIRQGNEFKGVEMTWKFADPYVIFQEVKKMDVRDTKRVKKEDVDVEEPIDGTSNPAKVAQNETWAKKGKLFVDRDGIIFNELNRRFRELFADEFKLEPLETCGPDKKGRVLTCVVMWNRNSFEKLSAETGNPVPPGIRAFYSPPQQKIFHYIGEESLQGSDEVPIQGGYVQKQSDQVTFHEGTHQLQHEYTAIFNGHPLTDGTVVVNGDRCMWFEEGIAEFMGAAEVEADKAEYLEGAKWRHNRILIDRISESRDYRESTQKWTIKEFLKCRSNKDLFEIGQKLDRTDGNMPSHFYCRAWAFCHFLWYYDNGKYRPKFMNFLRETLKGTWSTEKFAKDMGRPNVNDWGPVDKEFEWYWSALLLRDVRKMPSTGRYKTITSDAPEGKVEDDAGFCEAWDEAHKAGKKEEPKPEAPATTPPPKDAPKPPKK